MVWMVALLGCVGTLSRDDACELGAKWIELHDIQLNDGTKARDSEVGLCSEFRSNRSEDFADVDLQASTLDDEDLLIRYVAHCALVRFDQGWEVEICTERPEDVL